MSNRVPFGIGEWYHCYTRGVDKRDTFETEADYLRFIQILYLSNSKDPIHRSDLHLMTHDKILQKERGEPLVAIGAYCLMPNHFHLLIQEICEGGIARFMQKVGTSYAMYFNIKNERIGNLFVKPFRSKHIDDEAYGLYIAQYIHLNAMSLFAQEAQERSPLMYVNDIEDELSRYRYSSYIDYYGEKRPERAILDPELFDVIADNMPSLKKALRRSNEYHQELSL